MTTAPIRWAEEPVAKSRRLITHAVVVRFALVALAVAVCYLFEWRWLRDITCTLNMRLDALFGVHLQRVAWDQVVWRGATYRYVIACTFADVWCGSIPLLWSMRRPVWRNAGLLLLWGAVLIAFNVVRLSISDVLFATGLSWDLAHNVISGVAYFLVWEWVWPHRAPEMRG